MDKPTYDNLTATDLVGKKVVTLAEMSNGLALIPIGQTMTITKKGTARTPTFDLISEPCSTCEVKLEITGVGYADVDLVSQVASAGEIPRSVV